MSTSNHQIKDSYKQNICFVLTIVFAIYIIIMLVPYIIRAINPNIIISMTSYIIIVPFTAAISLLFVISKLKKEYLISLLTIYGAYLVIYFICQLSSISYLQHFSSGFTLNIFDYIMNMIGIIVFIASVIVAIVQKKLNIVILIGIVLSSLDLSIFQELTENIGSYGFINSIKVTLVNKFYYRSELFIGLPVVISYIMAYLNRDAYLETNQINKCY